MSPAREKTPEALLLEQLRKTNVPYKDQGQLGEEAGWKGSAMWRKYEGGHPVEPDVLARMVFVAGGDADDLIQVGRDDALPYLETIIKRQRKNRLSVVPDILPEDKAPLAEPVAARKEEPKSARSRRRGAKPVDEPG